MRGKYAGDFTADKPKTVKQVNEMSMGGKFSEG